MLLSARLQAKKPKQPKDWTGHKISEVIDANGAPDTVYDDPETKFKVFVWQWEHVLNSLGRVSTHSHGGGGVHQTVTPGPSAVYKTSGTFWIDSEGNITKWKQDKSSRVKSWRYAD